MKQFPWIFTTLWLLILAVMITAGFWQLSRAEEKRQINLRLSSDQFQTPGTDAEWSQLQAFNQVRVFGQYLNTHMILDNQIMEGQVGHFVFTAFQTINQQLILVNRGWLPEINRDLDINQPADEITALVADWPRPGFQLGEQDVAATKRQHLTYMPQRAVSEVLATRHCGSPIDACTILPWVLKLDAEMPHGFAREWQLPRMTVEKHRAYAAQWFTMSLVLCLVYGIFLRKVYASSKTND